MKLSQEEQFSHQNSKQSSKTVSKDSRHPQVFQEFLRLEIVQIKSIVKRLHQLELVVQQHWKQKSGYKKIYNITYTHGSFASQSRNWTCNYTG